MPTSFKNSPYFLCHYGVKGPTSLLATVSTGVSIGSGISAAGHTTAWAYNSVKKRKADKASKRNA